MWLGHVYLLHGVDRSFLLDGFGFGGGGADDALFLTPRSKTETPKDLKRNIEPTR